MNHGQKQHRRYYQLWSVYFLTGSAFVFLSQWFAVPRILSDLASVLYIAGMVVLGVISPPSGGWRSRIPELLRMLVLAGVALVVTFILWRDLRYIFAITLLLWGGWFLTRSEIPR